MTPFSLDPTVQRDLADFLKELRQQSARFVVVGGWAVMAHTGKPRPTKDLDIYVAPDDPNLARVARALGSFGAPANLCSLDALRPDQNAKFGGVTFGLPPNRIDVLSKMAVAFEEIEPRAVDFEMDGHAIPVASQGDLVTLKRIALEDNPSRKTDRADLKALEALRSRSR
jgi:hypothetical protein